MPPDFDSELREPLLSGIQSGVMAYTYRGIACHKSPFDLAIYQVLLHRLQPATVIEIGTKAGGSALWFADMAELLCGDVQVWSLDIQREPPQLRDPRIRLLKADAIDLEGTAGQLPWSTLPHPWLVVEDSAHTYEASIAVLRFFSRLLQPGDYVVVEDGVVRSFAASRYAGYADGPCRAIEDFLTENPAFEQDLVLCNMFGRNVTYNPGGYLVRKSW